MKTPWGLQGSAVLHCGYARFLALSHSRFCTSPSPGTGLGRNQQGISAPIDPVAIKGGTGLGFDLEKAEEEERAAREARRAERDVRDREDHIRRRQRDRDRERRRSRSRWEASGYVPSWAPNGWQYAMWTSAGPVLNTCVHAGMVWPAADSALRCLSSLISSCPPSHWQVAGPLALQLHATQVAHLRNRSWCGRRQQAVQRPVRAGRLCQGDNGKGGQFLRPVT